MKRNNILAVIAIIALAGCLMLACPSTTTTGEGDGSTSQGGYDGKGPGRGGGGGGGGPQLAYINSGPSEIVIADVNGLDFQYITYSVTGASSLIWDIGNTAYVQFSAGTAPATPVPALTSGTQVITKATPNANGVSTHTVVLIYVAEGDTTLTLTAKDPITGYLIGDAKVVTLRSFENFYIKSININQSDVPDIDYYNDDTLDQLKGDPVWDNFYVTVYELQAGNTPVHIGANIFELTFDPTGLGTAGTDSAGTPFTVIGGPLTVFVTENVSGNSHSTDFTLYTNPDTAPGYSYDSAGTSTIQDMLLGIYEPGDEDDVLDAITVTFYWDNERNSTALTGAFVNPGEEEITWAVLTASSTIGTVGGWTPDWKDATSGTGSFATSFTSSIRYTYSGGTSTIPLVVRLVAPSSIGPSSGTGSAINITMASNGTSADDALDNVFTTVSTIIGVKAYYVGANNPTLVSSGTDITDRITKGSFNTANSGWTNANVNTATTLTILLGWPDPIYLLSSAGSAATRTVPVVVTFE